MTATELIVEAKKITGEFTLAFDSFTAGSVGAAILAKSGRIYTGICIDLGCGIGFCAEHAAIAEMVKHRETAIDMVVAVGKNGIMPPCGRCRELMYQIDSGNLSARVIVSDNKIVTLDELLPYRWK